MDSEITSIFKVMAEMNMFSEIKDDLTELIGSAGGEELSETDLCAVYAAQAPMPFSEFKKKYMGPRQ